MAAFARRYYAGGGVATTLASSMSSSDTSFTITSATGWPGSAGADFFVVIDRDLSSEEHILCSSNSGTTVAVANRGQDGTTATTHNQNATVELCITAIDGDEANQVTNLLGNAAEGSLFYGKGAGTLSAKLAIGSLSQFLKAGSADPAYSDLWIDNPQTTTVTAALYQYIHAASGTFTITSPGHRAGAWWGAENNGSGVLTVSAASGVFLGLGMGSAGVSSFSLGAYGAHAVLYDDGTNYHLIGGAQDSGWLTVGGTGVAFQNSWVGGPTDAFAKYRLIGNRVTLVGQVENGSSATAAFTLPAGMRSQNHLAIACCNANGASGITVVLVGTDGTVAPAVNTWGVYLNNISYLVD